MTRNPSPFPHAALYSLLLLLPVLLLLLLPVPCLGTQCALLLSIQLADPSSIEPSGLRGFCAWAFGPLLAATVLFVLGLAGYRLTGRPQPPRIHQVAVWGLFILAAFLAAWYVTILVTSIGASETPPMEFLGITALLALAAITLGQPLIVLWLFMVNRLWREFGLREETPG
jgi:hypothetical protein